MKRSVVTLLVLGLLAGMMVASPAEAAKKKKKTRKVQGSYAAPATIVGACSQTDGVGCMAIVSGPKETSLTAKVTDQHGQPVSISVEADLDGDSSTETSYGSFCGETEEPIQIDPGVELIFWVGRADVALLDACAPGAATQGTMDVIFST
ncbi:MAG: hypothetical protein M3238_02550 [Actinomycetota bacterium]|nr:hypothetical protein [Actinomycetota bacterium]